MLAALDAEKNAVNVGSAFQKLEARAIAEYQSLFDENERIIEELKLSPSSLVLPAPWNANITNPTGYLEIKARVRLRTSYLRELNRIHNFRRDRDNA